MPFGKLRFFSLNSRTTLSLVFLGCLSGGMQHTCCAQTSHGTKVAASDKTASSLIHDAESLPPEFAADIVLQIVETDTSLTVSQKIKALKSAFDKLHRPKMKFYADRGEPAWRKHRKDCMQSLYQ